MCIRDRLNRVGFEIFENDLPEIFFGNISNISLLVFFNLVFLAPIKEEIIVRRFLYVALRKKFNFMISAVIGSVFFAAIHGNVLTAFFYGIMACYIYEKYCDLNINILVHSMINFFLILIFVFFR